MIKAIVTDIEGTTSSLSFVKDVLFPYARQHIANYVSTHADDSKVAECLLQVREEVGKPLSLDQCIEQLIQWIDEDRKITPLKFLQGLIWEAGYKAGDYKGHIYEDAYRHLRAWHDRGVELYVYSSGSVYAQQLLFGHTEYGDLNYLFSGYFDTKIGAKVETASYQKIVESIGEPASSILFLSDIQAELDASAQAGMQTYWLVRDGSITSLAAHKQVKNFDKISLD